MDETNSKKRPHEDEEKTAEDNTATEENGDDDNNKEKEPIKQQRTAITMDGEMPQKKFYRQRAHCNPLSHNDSFQYPIQPNLMDWTLDHYPDYANNDDKTTTKITPTVLDIGCGFGGLTMALSDLLPNERILGMEIRAKVTEYVRLRIMAHRANHDQKCKNASVIRTNSMKYLSNYFAKGSIHKLFFCFPDPHFKRKNWGRRIISRRLLSEYAFVLQVGCKLYCITDVKELHDWHVKECDAHPLFRRLSDDETEQDPCVHAMKVETEEGKKVARNKGSKYYAVYERIDRPVVSDAAVDAVFESIDEFFEQAHEDDKYKSSAVAADNNEGGATTNDSTQEQKPDNN